MGIMENISIERMSNLTLKAECPTVEDMLSLPKENLRELIAEVFHDAWTDWAKEIKTTEVLTEKRLNRWDIFLRASWCQIPENERKMDYYYADRVMRRLALDK